MLSTLFAFRTSWLVVFLILIGISVVWFLVRVVVDFVIWFKEEIIEDFRDKKKRSKRAPQPKPNVPPRQKVPD